MFKIFFFQNIKNCFERPKQMFRLKDKPGLVVQTVACLTADPGIANLIKAQSHTFIEIDHEIISTVSLLLLLIQEGLLSFTSKSMCTKYWLTA